MLKTKIIKEGGNMDLIDLYKLNKPELEKEELKNNYFYADDHVKDNFDFLDSVYGILYLNETKELIDETSDDDFENLKDLAVDVYLDILLKIKTSNNLEELKEALFTESENYILYHELNGVIQEKLIKEAERLNEEKTLNDDQLEKVKKIIVSGEYSIINDIIFCNNNEDIEKILQDRC